MRILVLSPRVAPGILTLAAWDALREAASAHAAEGNPHVQAIVESGIDVDVSPAPPSYDPDTVWIAPIGDTVWAHTVAGDLMGGDGGDVEVIFGSYDLPGATLLDVVDIMDRLRRECVWTAQQTHETLSPYLLEEAQETMEALDNQDSENLREELGDLLMQVVFHARIAAEGEGWDIDDVAAGIAGKLIHRNPHVFGDVIVNSVEEVEANWQRLKAIEKNR